MYIHYFLNRYFDIKSKYLFCIRVYIRYLFYQMSNYFRKKSRIIIGGFYYRPQHIQWDCSILFLLSVVKGLSLIFWQFSINRLVSWLRIRGLVDVTDARTYSLLLDHTFKVFIRLDAVIEKNTRLLTSSPSVLRNWCNFSLFSTPSLTDGSDSNRRRGFLGCRRFRSNCDFQ